MAADSMGDHDGQRELFASGVDDRPGSPQDWTRPEWRSIAPGDWLSIEHEGRTIVGMIYRFQDEAYRFVYWDDRVLRFGSTTRDRIGPWDEQLTAQFRGQIAINPSYVEKSIAVWVMQPEPTVRAKPDTTSWKSRKAEPTEVQLRLFPE
jgi:hypothetical protein